MSYPDFMIDKRIVERHIKRGLVDPTKLDKTIEALPDMEHNAEACLADPVPEAEVEGAEAEGVEAESADVSGVEASDAAKTAVGGLAAPVEPSATAGEEHTKG